MVLAKWFPLFIAAAAIETTTQICLKKGAAQHKEISGPAYYLMLLRNNWVISGILFYFIEMAIWVILLSHISLSVAFPLTGLQKVFIILFSVFILRESVSALEWAGVGVIMLGIAVIVQAG